MNFRAILLLILSPLTYAQNPKILALHGGGGTGASFAEEINDLTSAMPDYEFVFANGAYGSPNNRLWISDPPGGKGNPTTDPYFSDASIDALDALLASEGPFVGIIGYSQGAAYVSVYLSRVPVNTFQFAASFCGYPTLTHEGILGVVNAEKPFGDIPALIWMGAKDKIISNPLSEEQIEFYTNPTVITSPNAGHYVPGSSDETFESVVSFMKMNTGSSAPTQTSTPTLQPVTDSPTTTQSPSMVPKVGIFIKKVKEEMIWKGKRWTGVLILDMKLEGKKLKKGDVTVLAEYNLGKKPKQKSCKTNKKGVCKLKLPRVSYKKKSIDVSLVEVTSKKGSYDESQNAKDKYVCPIFSTNCPTKTVHQPEYGSKDDDGNKPSKDDDGKTSKEDDKKLEYP